MCIFDVHICCIRLGIKHRYCRIHQTDSLPLRQFLIVLKFHSLFLLTEKYGNRYIAKPSFINSYSLTGFHFLCKPTAVFRPCFSFCLQTCTKSWDFSGNRITVHWVTKNIEKLLLPLVQEGFIPINTNAMFSMHANNLKSTRIQRIWIEYE